MSMIKLLSKRIVNRSFNVSLRKYATKDIYVGNIPFVATQEDISELFQEEVDQGIIEQVRVPIDRFSGQTKGFAFLVTHEDMVEKMVGKYDGVDFKGRFLRVRESTPKVEPNY